MCVFLPLVVIMVKLLLNFILEFRLYMSLAGCKVGSGLVLEFSYGEVMVASLASEGYDL